MRVEDTGPRAHPPAEPNHPPARHGDLVVGLLLAGGLVAGARSVPSARVTRVAFLASATTLAATTALLYLLALLRNQLPRLLGPRGWEVVDARGGGAQIVPDQAPALLVLQVLL